MSLSEQLDDVFELLQSRDPKLALSAFDVFAKFPDELVADFLRRDDHQRARRIVELFAGMPMVNVGLLETVVLLAQTEAGARLVAANEKVVQKLFALAKSGEPLAFVLPLTQISRMAAAEVHATLHKLNGNYFSLLEDTFNACEGGRKLPQRLINVAYIFLNVSQHRQACEQLFADRIQTLSSFVTNATAILSFRVIVAKILLNIAGHVDLHSLLTSDQTLADIVDPFADESDEISAEEMDKLPVQLQYVDHKRSESTHLLEALTEVLAQLCSSKLGRQRMREAGIYAIMREFDKSRRDASTFVEGRFMPLDGTPEWNLLMNTLLFDDHELRAHDDELTAAPAGITEFDLESLAHELDAIERENGQRAERPEAEATGAEATEDPVEKKPEAEDEEKKQPEVEAKRAEGPQMAMQTEKPDEPQKPKDAGGSEEPKPTEAKDEALTQKTHHLLKEVIKKGPSEALLRDVQQVIDELIETTATAVDLGSQIITQIRVLGALADNLQRPAEIVEACLLIENVMLKMSTEWEMIDALWFEEKTKAQKKAAEPKEAPRKADANKLGTQLNAVEAWVHSARKRFQKDPTNAPALLSEGQHQEETLRRLAAEIRHAAPQSPLDMKCGQLERTLAQLLAELQAGGRPDERIAQFLQNADSMLHQLEQMRHDLQTATSAVANELWPLAKQKTAAVVEEGALLLRQIGAHAEVDAKLHALRAKLAEIERAAKERADGNVHLSAQLQQLAAWLRDQAEPFLTKSGYLGSDNATAQEFLGAHWGFATDLINKEAAVGSILNRAYELNEDGKKQVQDFFNRYENVKLTLEKRIQLGNTFKQAYKFGADLDKQLHAISALLDDNRRNFTDEGVHKQMNNLFYAIQSSLAQEKHQAEKFLSVARAAATNDVHLNADHAADAITAAVGTHERKFAEIQSKWDEWQRKRTEVRSASQTVEEVQLWQIDTSEFIRLLEQKVAARTETTEERERLRQEITREIRELPVQRQTQRLDEAFRVFQANDSTEDSLRRVSDAQEQQESIARRVDQLQAAVQRTTQESSEEHRVVITRQQESSGQQPTEQSGEQKPLFTRPLQNVAVDEGESARLECEIVARPEPQCTWFREEEVIRESERIRLEYIGDRCALTIDDVRPQDAGLYKVKAQNALGETSNFCRLQVNPRKQPPAAAAKTPTGADEPPNFQPSLMNQVIREGEPAVIQVRTTGRPTPSVQWTKDDQPIRQSANVRLAFEEDGWSRVYIQRVGPEDVGLYLARAVNESGEARTGATLNMMPRNYGLQQQHEQQGQQQRQQLHQERQYEEHRWEQQGQQHGLQHQQQQQEQFQRQTQLEPQPQPYQTHQQEVIREQHTTHFTRGATEPLERTIPIRQQRESAPAAAEPSGGHSFHRTTTVIGPGAHDQLNTTTRFPVTDECSDFGFSSLANAPQFIRPFQQEYTVNEGEKTRLDCLMTGNPRPKVQWLFNDRPIVSNWQFAEFTNIGDTYSIAFSPANLHNAGKYTLKAANVQGSTECSTLIHVRPKSLIPQPAPVRRTPHRVIQGFGSTEYEAKSQPLQRGTPPPAKRSVRIGQPMSTSAYQQRSEVYNEQPASQPPHFLQTLTSCVAVAGDSARFDGVNTGPSVEVQWTRDGEPISAETHPHIRFVNEGGRIGLVFTNADPKHSGKYMATIKNQWGIATSSAQFVVRPRTTAPDFVQRLISEEVAEGEGLRWTVRLTGDPEPTVTWLRNGVKIPHCDEVRLLNEGNGVHSLLIERVEQADGGQFTCIATNLGGEARSTADLVVRPVGAEPNSYFHVTKMTQEKLVNGEEVTRNQSFSIESPRQTPAR
ncbi:Muscle M-line assembly protein unc-89 [Aphelenchoides fujianensis]|nr:Muscle M-line assembly protein unc-89 [Aphelenchoides fujianensis]